MIRRNLLAAVIAAPFAPLAISEAVNVIELPFFGAGVVRYDYTINDGERYPQMTVEVDYRGKEPCCLRQWRDGRLIWEA